MVSRTSLLINQTQHVGLSNKNRGTIMVLLENKKVQLDLKNITRC